MKQLVLNKINRAILLPKNIKETRYLPAAVYLTVLSIFYAVNPSFAGTTLVEPPIVKSTDARNVDMASLSLDTPKMTMSIGDNKNGLISKNESYNSYTDNFDSAIIFRPASPLANVSSTETAHVSYQGQTEIFTNSNGVFLNAYGGSNTLTCTGLTPGASKCYYTLKDGAVATYSWSQVRSIGRSVTNTIYVVNEGPRLTEIKKPSGEIITISYRATSSNALLSSVVSSLGWMINYNNLTTTTVSNGANHTQKIQILNNAYTYCAPQAASCSGNWNFQTRNTFTLNTGPSSYSMSDATGNTISQENVVANGVSPYGDNTVTYNSIVRIYQFGRDWPLTGVAKVIQAGTGTWTYTVGTAVGSIEKHVASDSLGYQKSYDVYVNYSTWDRQVRAITDEIGRKTSYTYDAVGRLSKVIAPDATYNGAVLLGGYTNYGYDARGNLQTVTQIPKDGSAGKTVTMSYDATCTNVKTCNKPNYVLDAKGNRTDYTYDATHGGVLTETGPGDYNSVRPQVRYGYSQLYPQVLNASGALVNSTPVWLLTSTSSCRTATSANPASCVGTDQETVTQYEYGSYNLQLTKVTVRAGNANVNNPASPTNVWQSTSYQYDQYGHRVVTDGPLPGTYDQSYTVFDILGRPVYDIGIDPDGAGVLPSVAIHHLYDIYGREYRTETGRGNGANMRTCSSTAASCSYFTVTSYIERTYDPNTGLEVKSVTAQP